MHTEAADTSPAAEEEPTGEKGQLEELTCALEEEKRRSEDYLNRLKYMQADFENLKKRSDRQLEETRVYCTERLVLEILGVVDELEAAVQQGRQAKSAAAVVQGVDMILKNLTKILEKEDVTPIKCIGQVFDPGKHEATAKAEGDEEGRIVEEIRKGYVMKGKVIRPSIVKITVKPCLNTMKEASDEQPKDK
jgi:molecular chaperone GrpE